MRESHEPGPRRAKRKVPVGGDVDPLRIDVQGQAVSFGESVKFGGWRRSRKLNLAVSVALGAQCPNQGSQVWRCLVHSEGKVTVHSVLGAHAAPPAPPIFKDTPPPSIDPSQRLT